MSRLSLIRFRGKRAAIVLAGAGLALGSLAAALVSPMLVAGEKPADPAALEKPVKDFSLSDVSSGKEVKLSDQKGKVVVLFWHSPNCSVSPFYDERVKALVEAYKAEKESKKKVVVLAVNSSSGDNPEDVRDYAKSAKFNFAVLKDDDASVAQYFGIQQTGTCIVIDDKGNLRYRGGFDDNPDAEHVKRKYVKDAVDSILAGKKFLLRETLSFG